MDLSKYISHSRDREYMSGVERDKLRIKFTSEIFTKTKDVKFVLLINPEDNLVVSVTFTAQVILLFFEINPERFK